MRVPSTMCVLTTFVVAAILPACSDSSSRAPADSETCDRMAHALVLAYSGVTGREAQEALESVLASADISPVERDVTEAMVEQVRLGDAASSDDALAAFDRFVATFEADCPATGKPGA